jgi:hypothetical protein
MSSTPGARPIPQFLGTVCLLSTGSDRVGAISRLSVSAYVEFDQATNRTFDPYMPIVVVGAISGGIVLVIYCQIFVGDWQILALNCSSTK